MGVRFGHVVRSGRGLGNGYVRTGPPPLGDVLCESEREKVYSSRFRDGGFQQGETDAGGSGKLSDETPHTISPTKLIATAEGNGKGGFKGSQPGFV
jgi:hypothetical protein